MAAAAAVVAGVVVAGSLVASPLDSSRYFSKASLTRGLVMGS